MPDTEKTVEEIEAELEELLSQERRFRGQSLEKFVEIYLKKHLTAEIAPFQREMMRILEHSVTEDGAKRVLFFAPRGFGKSFVCSFFFPLWCVLYGHKEDIILVSATMALAKRILGKIRQEIENNELLLRDFGELRSDKWTEEMLVFKNSAQITAKGRGFQIRGFRPDQIICDDLEDEETIYSSEQREKTEHWFFRTLIPTLKPNQNLTYVGTKLHQFSLMVKLQEKPEFLTKFYQALVNGRSIWESQWPTEELNKRRESMSEYAFQAEYMNNPISLEEQPVKAYMLENVHLEGKIDQTVLAIDPAISLKTLSDPRAISIFARLKNDKGEITGFKELFSESGRWSVDEQIEKVIRLFQAYSVNRIIVETVAFQKIFAKDLIEKARAQGVFLPISTAELGVGVNKRPKDKATRLMEVVHLFEQKLVEVNNPKLIQELLSFPYGDHDDMVDATVFALYPLMKFGKGAFIAKSAEKKLPLDTKEGLYFKEIRPGVWGTTPGKPDASKSGVKMLVIGKKR